MSREELALETQLLLQEVSQVTQRHQAEAIVDQATAASASASEYEAAKVALLDKLRRKKEVKRQQMQQVNQRRFGVGALPAPSAIVTDASDAPSQLLSPTAARKISPLKQRNMMKLPVAAGAGAASRKQKDMLSKLRTQAIQQGSQEMAKLFGYSSYEEQLKHLNKIEKHKILQHELIEQAQAAKEAASGEDVTMVDEDEDGDKEEEEEEADEDENDDDESGNAAEEAADQVLKQSEDGAALQPQRDASANKQVADDSDDAMDTSVETDAPLSDPKDATASARNAPSGLLLPATAAASARATSSSPVARRRTTKRITVDDEDDGNDADSEQDGKDADEHEADGEDDGFGTSPSAKSSSGAGHGSPAPKKDRAAAYRRLLQEEARQNKLRKRLKQSGDFVEAEAEEDDDEDVLKIGGLGDFGFGVPQAKTQESKEAEEERNALRLREDDLDGIVDDLSDDEREQAQGLDELFRKELEDQDRHQLKEVMRNVKEGFGRNRRAFSSAANGAEARGRFNLDELVAADGKLEAARLGLLESDEELSDSEKATRAKAKTKKTKAKKTKGSNNDDDDDDDEEEEDDEEEDEEAEMERMLRERFQNQPKIYITSSESEDDDDDAARDALKNAAGAADSDAESDEERERQQMKLFSERARVNRRMQRMKELQRQVASERGDAGASAQSGVAVLPNLLLEEDEDAQELMKLLNRSDKAANASALDTSAAGDKRSAGAAASGAAGARRPVVRPRMGFGIAASSRSSSSFSRVAKNVTMFNTNNSSATSSKGFVFTSSFSSDRADQGDENAAPDDSAALPQGSALTKSRSWSAGGGKRGAAAGNSRQPAAAKKQRKSDFLSVLSSFQRVTHTTSSASSSQPM
ncbi:hypothetical protein PybrP1_000002 [[Pythium] brassicae (nom. inval.)]|nr:hypothetical protein PybrP1_000002 [[Pythium] brassicae (nom. inval.)]